MKRVTSSAPGKVVICGEYAVLDGAPAIAMAVDRRAIVSIRPASAAVSSVAAPGHATGRCRFEAATGAIDWIDDGSAFGVVDAVWRAASVDLSTAVDIELDTREFIDAESGFKLGIGSSAALVAALASALRDAGAELDVNGTAFDAHRAFQQGAGSGVDVATALTGGLLQYYMEGHQCRTLAWPAGIHFGLYWSRTPADTVERIGRFREAADRGARETLALAAERAAAAWSQGDVTGILIETRSYRDELDRYDRELDLDIFAAGHRELAGAAPDEVLYKPCGAGGGDIGIALSPDPAALRAFSSIAADHTFRKVPLALDSTGAGAVKGNG